MKRITEHVCNNVMDAFKALSILVDTEKQSLDLTIQSGHSLAVKAVILKGNYQITDQSLYLAIRTNNPEIVKSIINTGVESNSKHIIHALEVLGDYSLDEEENQNTKDIIKTLVNAIRVKGQKIGQEVLMNAIEKENWSGIRLLIKFNIPVKEEHLNILEKGWCENIEWMSALLKNARQKQIEAAADAEKIKNLWVLGSGLRTKTGFFAIPTEVVMKIVNFTGNESKPVTFDKIEKFYDNKPKL
jgi:hypothetical protein